MQRVPRSNPLFNRGLAHADKFPCAMRGSWTCFVYYKPTEWQLSHLRGKGSLKSRWKTEKDGQDPFTDASSTRGVQVQSGAETMARRSARDLQQRKYGTMCYSVFWKFNQYVFCCYFWCAIFCAALRLLADIHCHSYSPKCDSPH
jgi:hypothetical protein